MKDLTPVAEMGVVVRVAVWDAVTVDGSDVLVDTLLRGSRERGAARAISGLDR